MSIYRWSPRTGCLTTGVARSARSSAFHFVNLLEAKGVSERDIREDFRAIEAVVADANVLLSAVIGKAAQAVFSKYRLEVHATEFNALEVEEYLPPYGEKVRFASRSPRTAMEDPAAKHPLAGLNMPDILKRP